MIGSSRLPLAAMALALTAGLTVLGASADPATEPPATPSRSEGADGRGAGGAARDWARQFMEMPAAERRAKFREFLTARLERTRRTQQALMDSIEGLDSGKSVEEVITAYPPELRWGGDGAGWMGGRRVGAGGPGGGFGRGGDEPNPTLEDLNELGPVMPGGDEPRLGRGGPRGGGDAGAALNGAESEPRPRGDREKPAADLTDDDRQAFDEFLASAAPGIHTLYLSLREKDPERADRKVREGLPRLRWLIDLRRRDPEAYQLRLRDIRHGREALEASRSLAEFDRDHPAQADSAERSAIAEQLRTALREQYEVRGRLLEHEISRLDQDLSRRRAELQTRPAGREAAINRTVDRLRERARDWLRNAATRGGKGRAADAPPPRERD